MATERGIGYRPEMILCKLDGSKTMTRRVLKTQPGAYAKFHHIFANQVVFTDGTISKHTYGEVGDWLYARESFCAVDVEQFKMIAYKATPRLGLRVPGVLGPVDFMTYLDESTDLKHHALGYPLKWKSGRFMPRLYARIKDEIVSLRAERLQEITDADMLAEGMTIEKVAQWTGRPAESIPSLREAFAIYWDSINEVRGFGWSDNPMVLVVGTKPVPRDVWLAAMAAIVPAAAAMPMPEEMDEDAGID